MAANHNLSLAQMETSAAKHGITTRNSRTFDSGAQEIGYTHYSPARERGVVSQTLDIEVSHTHDRPYFAYPGDKSSTLIGEVRAGEELAQAAQSGAPKLFGMSQIPGQSKVVYASGTKGGRVHLGGLLGLAYMDTQRSYPGRQLQASSDLSPHSARLVGKSKGRGLVSAEHRRSGENQMDFTESYPEDVIGVHAHAQHMGHDVLTPAETRTGSRTMRTLLKNPTLDKPDRVRRVTNPDQLQLPGMT